MAGRVPLWTPNLQHPLNQGAVAWWLSTPPSMGGGTWLDLMGRYSGTLTNMGVGSVSGWGQAISRPGAFGFLGFDGTNDVVQVPYNTAFDLTGSMTVAAAFYTTNAATSQHIFSKQGASGARAWGLGLSSSSANLLQMALAINSLTLITRLNATTITANLWYWIGASYDAVAQTLDIYVNGKPDNGTLLGVVPSSQFTANSLGLAIGARPISSLFLTGAADDVMLWNRALSAAEFSQRYTAMQRGYHVSGLLRSAARRTYSVPGGGPLLRRIITRMAA